MELITDDIEIKEGQILPMRLTNYEELKKQIIDKMTEYKGMKVSEEKLKEAKTYRANLNNFKKAISAQRIAKTREVEEQVGLSNYIKNCTELEKYVDDASNFLDKQIKDLEKIENDKKLKEITDFFMENVGEFKELIDFDKIYDKKWLNKTCKMEDIQIEIRHIFAKTKTDFDVIKTQFKDESIQKQVQQYYLSNIANDSVLTLAILEGNKVIEQNKKLEELKQRETENTKKITENEKNITTTVQNVPQNENLKPLNFRVLVTQEQMKKLRDFLITNNIKYGPVPENNKSKKVLILDYSESKDDYGDVRGQELSNKNEKISFIAYNLCECPEDAIIGRDLFTADDYISALSLGIELAQKGYTDIEINEIESEEE